MDDSPTISLPGNVWMASPAPASVPSRSPRFEPRAMYATSGTAHPLDHDLRARQRSGERNVRLSHGDPHALDVRAGGECRARDVVRHLLDEVDRSLRRDAGGRVVQRPVVDERTAGRHANGEIDLERLRGRALVRENADQGVK